MMLHAPWMQVLVTMLGLVMGSAVTALAHRVPRGLSWVHGRSACPSCRHVLGAADLVPVLSWASTRGRCRYCRARISWRYPLTEIACGVWALLLWQVTGPTWAYPLLALWGFLLVALFWIDLDYQLLPDVLTLPGTLVGVAAALTLPAGGWHAILGMALGSGLLALLAWGYEKVRHVEGMGGGDIKLAAMFGAVLGWQLTLLTLAIAALAGTLWGALLIARKRGSGMTALPFGTLLAPAAMVAFLWGAGWLNAYMRMIRSL
jgi:leader peptidase (prepilin peptidase)/N-methyltransferase